MQCNLFIREAYIESVGEEFGMIGRAEVAGKAEV